LFVAISILMGDLLMQQDYWLLFPFALISQSALLATLWLFSLHGLASLFSLLRQMQTPFPGIFADT